MVKSTFSPIFYRRFIDDVITVFNDSKHIDMFHKFLNERHPNLKFTIEVGSKSLAFLDVLIKLKDEIVTTEIYRKPTFTGLLLNYGAMCPIKWKNSLVNGMLHRAYTVSSDWNLFHIECSKIMNILKRNSYPINMIQKSIKHF